MVRNELFWHLTKARKIKGCKSLKLTAFMGYAVQDSNLWPHPCESHHVLVVCGYCKRLQLLILCFFGMLVKLYFCGVCSNWCINFIVLAGFLVFLGFISFYWEEVKRTVFFYICLGHDVMKQCGGMRRGVGILFMSRSKVSLTSWASWGVVL